MGLDFVASGDGQWKAAVLRSLEIKFILTLAGRARSALLRSRVRFGSLADIPTSPRHVRFTPNNGSWAAHPSLHLAVGL